MRSGSRRSAGGFTIVECLLAGVILAAFAAALSGSMINAGRSTTRGEDHRRAAQWLDVVLTRIDMLGPYQLSTEGPLQGDLDERFRWEADIELDEALPDLYRVTVTVSYIGTDLRPGRVTAYTQLYDPAGLRSLDMAWEEL